MSINETFTEVPKSVSLANLALFERHAVSRGFRCKIMEGYMIIYIPIYDFEMKKSAELPVRCTKLTDVYNAMLGYSANKK